MLIRLAALSIVLSQSSRPLVQRNALPCNGTIAPATGCTSNPSRYVVGLGDSIFLASGSGQPQVGVSVAGDLSSRYGVPYGGIGEGVAGNTCADCLARWPSIKAAHPEMSHLVIMCGVNDARTGRTAAQAWEPTEEIINDALALGIEVRLVKTLNCLGEGSCNHTMINDLKVLQQAWCDTNGLACADPAATIQTGDAITSTLDQDDFLHLNAAGHALLVTSITVWAERAAEGW